MSGVPEIDLSDAEVLRDPFTAYGRAREQGPVARLSTPGFGSMWAVTRHAQARELTEAGRGTDDGCGLRRQP